jgi:hypothetical protein
MSFFARKRAAIFARVDAIADDPDKRQLEMHSS